MVIVIVIAGCRRSLSLDWDPEGGRKKERKITIVTVRPMEYSWTDDVDISNLLYLG